MESCSKRDRLKSPVVWICLALLVSFLGAVVIGWSCIRSWNVARADENIERGYRALKPGMSMEQVVHLMGKAPIATNTEFTLGQVLGNEREYEKAATANAAIFYTWASGIDMYYCVGFEANGRMAVKGKGGT